MISGPGNRLTSRCSGPRPRAALLASVMLGGPWPGPLSLGVRRQKTRTMPCLND